MRIKKVGVSTDYSSYEELKKYHVISQGFNEYGDLSFMFKDRKLLEKYCDFVSFGTTSGKNAFRQIMDEIKPHDIILAFEGNSVKGIAEVPDDFIYYFETEVGAYNNCLFPINWVDWTEFCKNNTINGQGGQGVKGVENCYNPPELVNYINENWNEYKDNVNYEIQLLECKDKLNELKEKFKSKKDESMEVFLKNINAIKVMDYINSIKEIIKTNKNIILHGAPGTGKTFMAKKIAKEMNAVEDFVQFHPSYDYADFVEGLRPIKKDGNNEIGFERKDGVFKAFCEKALKAYNAVEDKENAPKFVFVIDEINRGDMSKIFGELFFSIDPGYRGPEGKIRTQYANLNDEPNEFDKALGIKDAKNYGYFFVPENVYVIGTMNDIDRSVESMDFAMRRRFTFREITAEDSKNAMLLPKTFEKMLEKDDDKDAKLKKCKDSLPELITRMTKLNEKIESREIGLSKDYQIGAAYFLKFVKYVNDTKPFECLWKYHIVNVLKEYLRGTGEEQSKLKELEKAFNSTQQ